MSAENGGGAAQSDECNIICPYCLKSYQAESEDFSDKVREEECFNCGKTFEVWQDFSVTHHTRPIAAREKKPEGGTPDSAP